MNKPITILLAVSTLLVLTSCGEPRHLSWDYGRAYTEAFTLQANLTRPSIIASEYQLSGLEAANSMANWATRPRVFASPCEPIIEKISTFLGSVVDFLFAKSLFVTNCYFSLKKPTFRYKI